MKRRTVSYAPAAGDDLDWIYDTIADATSPITASGYERRIREFCDRLAYGAERGTLRDDLRPGLRIFYGGRDWEEDFR